MIRCFRKGLTCENHKRSISSSAAVTNTVRGDEEVQPHRFERLDRRVGQATAENVVSRRAQARGLVDSPEASLLCARELIVGCVEVAKTNGASAQASRSTIHTVHCNRQLIRDRRRTSKTACLTAPYHRCAMQASAPPLTIAAQRRRRVSQCPAATIPFSACPQSWGHPIRMRRRLD